MCLCIFTEKLSCGQSNIPPSQERTASKKASRAMKAMMLAKTLATSAIARDAPRDAASNKFLLSLKKKVELDWHCKPLVNTLRLYKQSQKEVTG